MGWPSEKIELAGDVSDYCKCILEIQLRDKFLSETLSRPATGDYHNVFRLEGAFLQPRMIVELLAFASLVSSREIYSREWASYRREGDFPRLMKRLRKVNPHFLPRAVTLSEAGEGVLEEITEIDDQLDEKQLIEVRGRMGNVLHARNPFQERPCYDEYRIVLETAISRIRAVLRRHVANLSGGTYLLLRQDPADGRFRTLLLGETDA